MDTGLPGGQSRASSNLVSQNATVHIFRAGVILDPVPLPRTSAALQTDVGPDLVEQRASQEQARLLGRFRQLRQWQQQQQTRLMEQQQQQLEMLRCQQQMVQQALVQQRLKQWGGNSAKSPSSESSPRMRSPGKSPVSSPSRATKTSSSLPIALAKASLELSALQDESMTILENMGSSVEQTQAHTPQEGTGFDSESDHPGSLSVDGIYPLPDTASEASDVDEGKENGCHDSVLGNGMSNDESDDDDDERFRSVSDQTVTPTASSPVGSPGGSPLHVQHLSIHLPDPQGTTDSSPPQSPPRDPSSPSISPLMSPFSPTSPARRPPGPGHTRQHGEGEGLEERPIQSNLGIEFKSFEELVELQLKSDKKTPSAGSTTTSEQTTARSGHTFLKRGEGIARFGMKPRKLKPRKTTAPEPSEKKHGELNKQPGKTGGSQKQSAGKKKTTKKDEPPKVSRKVSSKQPHSSADDVFKKPLPVTTQPRPTRAQQGLPRGQERTKPVSSPVEKEKVQGMALPRPQQGLVPPAMQSPGDSAPSGHDDTMEASFNRRAQIWEKKVKIEKEDLDEFEMLEQAADDNMSFCSEASLVVNVMQRAKKRKQELLGLSPHVKPPQLTTVLSVDAAEERDNRSGDQSPDSSPDETSRGPETEAQSQRSRMHSNRGLRTDMVHKETVEDDPFLRGQAMTKGGVALVRDDFYSSESSSEDKESIDDDDDDDDGDAGRNGGVMGEERMVMRKISKRTIQQSNGLDHGAFKAHEVLSGVSEEHDEKMRMKSNIRDDDEHEEESDEEEGDIEIFRSGTNESRNNNNKDHLLDEKKMGDDGSLRHSIVGKSNGYDVHVAMTTGSHMINNGHVTPINHASDDYEEEFEGTPRKTLVPPESMDQAEFEDEETWGDFTAHLSESSDDESIVAMAPTLHQSASSKEEGSKPEMKRKTSEKVSEGEDFPSPPPTSALVARLFPKLRQPDTKQKEMEQKEKVLHTVAERPAGEGSQARMLRDKLTQLENEIEKFRKENLLLARLREEREKGLDLMKREMSEFQQQKEEELSRLKDFREEETRKLKKERKLFEQHQKTLRTMPDKRDRAEIDMLKNQLSELQTELKQREVRWNASTKRLRDRTVALETENAELREEVRLLEQRRLAAWKREEQSLKGKSSSFTQSSHVPRPRPPASVKVEHSNNNNINRLRPGSEDRLHSSEGENHYYAMDKKKAVSESSEQEYLQAFPPQREVEQSKEEEKIYESRIQLRRSRSPSERERLALPTPNERTPSPSRTKPSSLSPSLPSSMQGSPLTASPRQHPRARNADGSPIISTHAGLNHGSPDRGVPHPPQNGGTGDYEEVVHNDGKVELIKSDGSRTLNFSNGTRKEISADGRTIIISFFNGDMKQILPDQRVVYYYSETKTTHTTYPDGLEILQFSNDQTEKHYPDGTKEITFPDHTIKYLYPGGGEESVFADGTVLRVEPSGQRIMEFPNGQREVHTDHYKKREYPDGTVKTVYPDGRQETRYSSGRVRIKDSAGNVIVDRKG